MSARRIAVAIACMLALAPPARANDSQSNDIRYGPVPGVAVRCGGIQPNALAVLSPSRGLVAAIVGSVTIRFQMLLTGASAPACRASRNRATSPPGIPYRRNRRSASMTSFYGERASSIVAQWMATVSSIRRA
jgi:hypothetical protein